MTHQIPPYRPPESLRPAVTAKDQIEAEAKKAAAVIRAALAEFNRATGLSADVQTYWVTESILSESTARVIPARVALCFAGVEVSG